MPNLFPRIDIAAAKRNKAVWAFCKRFGYGLLEDGSEDPVAWADGPAMLAFYNEKIVQVVKTIYRVEKEKEARADLPDPATYERELD